MSKGPVNRRVRSLRWIEVVCAALVYGLTPAATAAETRVALILDSSASMLTNDPDRKVLVSAAMAVAALHDGDLVMVVDTTTAGTKNRALIPPSHLTDNRGALHDTILGLDYTDRTYCYAALKLARPFLTEAPDPTSLRYALFLTDGECNVNVAEAHAELRELGEAGVRVFFVGLGHDVNAAALEELRKSARGEIVNGRARADDIPGIFGTIAGRILGSRVTTSTLTPGPQSLTADEHLAAMTAFMISEKKAPGVANLTGPGNTTAPVRKSVVSHRSGLHGLVFQIPSPASGSWNYSLTGPDRITTAVIHDSDLRLTLEPPSSLVLGDPAIIRAHVEGKFGQSPTRAYLENARVALYAWPPGDPERRELGSMKLQTDGLEFELAYVPDRQGRWVYEAVLEHDPFVRRESPRVGTLVGIRLDLACTSSQHCLTPEAPVSCTVETRAGTQASAGRDVLQSVAVSLEDQAPGQTDFARVVDKVGWRESHFEHSLPLPQLGHHVLRATAVVEGETFRSNVFPIEVYGTGLTCSATPGFVSVAPNDEATVNVTCRAAGLSHATTIEAALVFDGPAGTTASLADPVARIEPGQTVGFKVVVKADADAERSGTALVRVTERAPCDGMAPAVSEARFTLSVIEIPALERFLRWLADYTWWLLAGLVLFILYASRKHWDDDHEMSNTILEDVGKTGRGLRARNARATITVDLEVVGGSVHPTRSLVELEAREEGVFVRCSKGVRKVSDVGVAGVSDVTEFEGISNTGYQIRDSIVFQLVGF